MVLENLPSLEGKRVADVGTGSGVIAVVSALRGADEVIATDISDKAIENAKQNMRSNQVEDKVKVIKASVLNDIEDAFDYIFANIPILEEVWSSKGMEMKTVTKDLLQAATSKLNCCSATNRHRCVRG